MFIGWFSEHESWVPAIGYFLSGDGGGEGDYSSSFGDLVGVGEDAVISGNLIIGYKYLICRP